MGETGYYFEIGETEEFLNGRNRDILGNGGEIGYFFEMGEICLLCEEK